MSVTRAHLRDYLLHADEKAVYHAYPRHIASELNQDHRAILVGLAAAMFAGEVVLHWEVQCPMCGAQGKFADKLPDAPQGDLTCAACSGEFTPHLDEEIRVTFSPHPSLRMLTARAQDPGYHQQVASSFKATSGHELLTAQEFRDWAKEQPLPAGNSLEVRRAAFLFTDLSNSTALYHQRGDPNAFQLSASILMYCSEP